MKVVTLPKEHLTIIGKPFGELYESAFPRVAKFIRKMNGSFQDAKDLFQDALVIYYEKRLDEKFEIAVSEEAYVLGIVKHLWVRKFKHDCQKVSLDDSDLAITLSDDLQETPNESKLLQLLERTGKKCLELLHAFYYGRKSLREITAAFRYQNEHTTAVQKFKCLEKVRDTVKEKSISYEDFLE